MRPGNVLIDLAGLALSQEDKELIQHPAVAGVILFARNYHSPEQLTALTQSILKLRQPLMIAVDQEGGRVQRFLDGFTRLPAMNQWGASYQQQPEATREALCKTIHTMVSELQACGVNISLLPVLDINYKQCGIIGERSLHQDPEIVSELANILIECLHQARMPATGKHFPGHGAVTADSHKTLPVDSRGWNDIWKKDLLPYRKLINQLDAIMPAHIVYSELDDKPASFSLYWLQEVLRKQLKFDGVVISDDLSMEGAATMGSYSDRTLLALEAGCDLLLICNNRDGAIEALEGLEDYLNIVSFQRIKRLFKRYL